MTFLVERLAELLRHLEHLEGLRASAQDSGALRRSLTLHNDVLFSLFTVCQLVIDIAGELAARRGDRFEDYTEAIRSLGRDARFPAALVKSLEPLAGFRNVIAHDYVSLDLDRVIDALNSLEPIHAFAELVRGLEAGETR